jgi:hypothetical protein
LNKGYGTNGGVIGEYLGCTFLGACCTTSLMEENFHFELFFITIFGLGFYKSLGTIAIHIN